MEPIIFFAIYIVFVVIIAAIVAVILYWVIRKAVSAGIGDAEQRRARADTSA